MKVYDNLEVKLYSLSTCSHCKAVKRLFEELDVKYEFTDFDLLMADRKALLLEELKLLNPRCSFPTIAVGDKVIVGYREDEIRKALCV